MKKTNKADDSIKELWTKFLENRKDGKPYENVKKELVEKYYPLVKYIASRMHLKNNKLSIDEFTSMGVDGLYDAIENFDPNHEKKPKFETYASHRIRGSILDAIRKSDWIPRLVRSKTNVFEKEKQVAEHNAGRKLQPVELAKVLNISEEEVNELIDIANTPIVYSVNENYTNDNDDNNMSIDHIEDKNLAQPVDLMIRKEFFSKLMGNNFTAQEKKIIWLYYYEHRSMRDIAQMVNLCESRVSQMHNKILAALKVKADKNPDYFSDIKTVLSKFKTLSV